MATSICYNPTPMTLYEADGDRASGAKAYFYEARSTTPLSAFTDAPMTTPHPWPVVASGYGVLPPIYLAKGQEYKVRIEDAAGNILYAVDGIDNPAEVDSGGGGGGDIVTSAAQIHQTGDIVWNASAADRAGWVRCNGKTISPTAGSGTAMNNDICEDLFKYFWNNFSDTLCPVTPGGRDPSSAQADWDAHKSIATLDLRGYGIAGLDTMGNTAANRIQRSTLITTTNSSAAATVVDATGLSVGMLIWSLHVPTGTAIATLSGTSITMTDTATGNGTAVAARFSIFSDAQTPGAAGGQNTHIQTTEELAQHLHVNTASSTVTEPFGGAGHSHTVLTGAAGSDLILARSTGTPTYDVTPGTNDSEFTNAFTDLVPTGVTVATTMTNVNTGSGLPMNIWTPTRLGTYWIKV